MDATVVIPTFRRPRMLARALQSCLRERVRRSFEIVVVDNAPEGDERDTVLEIAGRTHVPIRYEHEREAGISHARNRGVRSSKSDRIVFLDDDEEAEPGWLEALLDAQERYDADAVFGAVVAQCEGGAVPDGMAWALPLFTRDFPDRAGPLSRSRLAYVGTGNSLFHRRALPGETPFSIALSLVGGEDTALIQGLALSGHKLAWCPAARVIEHMSRDRFELLRMLRYRVSCGQIRTSSCMARPRSAPHEAAFWMAAGAVQAVGNSALAAVGVLRPEMRNARLAAAAGGLGKVLWMSPFRVVRYQRPAS